MTVHPTPNEASVYVVNRRYVETCLSRIGASDGKALEWLAQYLLSCIPGCRTFRRLRTPSTDYDIVCAIEGPTFDFRSEVSRYFLCECNDWTAPTDFAALAKLSEVLDSARCNFGIIFSKNDITGRSNTTAADRERLKIYQRKGIAIVVLTETDLKEVAAGANLIARLRVAYEQIRLDFKSSEALRPTNKAFTSSFTGTNSIREGHFAAWEQPELFTAEVRSDHCANGNRREVSGIRAQRVSVFPRHTREDRF